MTYITIGVCEFLGFGQTLQLQDDFLPHHRRPNPRPPQAQAIRRRPPPRRHHYLRSFYRSIRDLRVTVIDDAGAGRLAGIVDVASRILALGLTARPDRRAPATKLAGALSEPLMRHKAIKTTFARESLSSRRMSRGGSHRTVTVGIK